MSGNLAPPTNAITPAPSLNTSVSNTALNTSGSNVQKPTVKYQQEKAVGQGTFGTVMLARNVATHEPVAIKKVVQDPRFKNRELQIMKSLSHPNVVALKQYYYTNGESKPEEVFLNLVMEFIPETLHRCCRDYTRVREYLPMTLARVFMYQLLRCIAYLHHPKINVCHRDIKPHNLLVDSQKGILKICDFGSAKQLVPSEPNVAYICSRYYRAPELIFGSQVYTPAIDIWSVGCILAEMLLGEPVFKGENSMGQLVEIIKVLGTPTREQVEAMCTNHKNREMKLPQIKPKPWAKMFREHVPAEAIDLVSSLLRYVAAERTLPQEAMCHPFFDELHNPNLLLPSGNPLPDTLFKFTEDEISVMTPAQRAKLVKEVLRK
jgi:serine/threonine protein kinase